MAQIIYGPYPMTIEQMSAWAQEVSRYGVGDCAKALQFLDTGRVTIRKSLGRG